MYELICEFVHCKGTSMLAAGTADSEDEAAQWVKLQEDLYLKGLSPFKDVNFQCEVALCQFKDCIPKFSYRVQRDDA